LIKIFANFFSSLYFRRKNMYKIIRRIFFLLNPESAHRLVFALLRLKPVAKFFKLICSPSKYNVPVELAGLHFPNPLGLAAGLDKDAEVVEALANLGFGFIEVGTVTPRPQPGNPKPRLFRLVSDNALINRMGFNNIGVQGLKENIKQIKLKNTLLGINIGKNKITPNEKAVDDYLYCYKELYDYADFFVVNVSSPNTPGLRSLQESEQLRKIFTALNNHSKEQNVKKPVFLKIAPDLSFEQLDEIIELVTELKIAGIVATNTTIERPDSLSSANKNESGGLSGKPLNEKSTQFIKYIHEKSGGKIPIIGVGGIFDEQDAINKLESGASAVEIFTSFIYEGPCVVKRIKKGLYMYFLNRKKINRFG